MGRCQFETTGSWQSREAGGEDPWGSSTEGRWPREATAPSGRREAPVNSHAQALGNRPES